MKRIDGRTNDQLRKLCFVPGYLTNPLASVAIELGNTKVVCAISAESRVPPWMRAQNVPGGWLTCEYGMLPASTQERMRREASNGKQSGRTVEIQRLIGRSLRGVLNLEKIGINTIYVDCDVINADGGTRCAGITGASVALQLALRSEWGRQNIKNHPATEHVAAVSVGIVDGMPMLDLCYEEDCRAEVDMNVVMTESGKFIEVQGTAEGSPFSRRQLDELLELAECGLKEIFNLQREIIDGAAPAFSDAKVRGTSGRKAKNLGNLGEVFDGVNL